jgi:hypothetical protein
VAEGKKDKVVQMIHTTDMTICESTAQMVNKTRRDGVELDLDRAENMKPCPIGADSACCKHCAMDPCRLSSKESCKQSRAVTEAGTGPPRRSSALTAQAGPALASFTERAFGCQLSDLGALDSTALIEVSRAAASK